jgi:hypothetical protein
MMDLSNDIFLKITHFIEQIGIPIRFCEITDETFLPGLMIEKGSLLIDKTRLKYIGDTLHEAGHIALMTPAQRQELQGSLVGQEHAEATEMMVIAWTYAACLEIGIDTSVVFHPEGYHGGSQSILENFGEGRYFGVPMLQWVGLTNERIDIKQNKNIAFPQMISWIRTY